MSTGTTDQAGRFSATDLRPGVYSLIAPGANGFMAYSLSVLPFRANGQDEVQRDARRVVPLATWAMMLISQWIFGALNRR